MSNFSRGMTIVAILFTLTGCYKGELSMGSLSPPIQKSYEISGSSHDEAFRMAHRALEESRLEIYGSHKETGQIDAGINGSANVVQGDSRTFVTNFAEFKFFLNKAVSGNLIFTVESRSSSGGQDLIDSFIQHYSKYVQFKSVSEDEVVSETAEQKPVAEIPHDQPDFSGQVISEIRTGSPILPETKYEFSKKEIVQIQSFLKKLGYDPGPVDGEMNSTTMEAIEKFKAENKVVKRLFE